MSNRHGDVKKESTFGGQFLLQPTGPPCWLKRSVVSAGSVFLPRSVRFSGAAVPFGHAAKYPFAEAKDLCSSSVRPETTSPSHSINRGQ